VLKNKIANETQKDTNDNFIIYVCTNWKLQDQEKILSSKSEIKMKKNHFTTRQFLQVVRKIKIISLKQVQ